MSKSDVRAEQRERELMARVPVECVICGATFKGTGLLCQDCDDRWPTDGVEAEEEDEWD